MKHRLMYFEFKGKHLHKEDMPPTDRKEGSDAMTTEEESRNTSGKVMKHDISIKIEDTENQPMITANDVRRKEKKQKPVVDTNAEKRTG